MFWNWLDCFEIISMPRALWCCYDSHFKAKERFICYVLEKVTENSTYTRTMHTVLYKHNKVVS